MATPTGKLIRNPQVINSMGTSTIAAPSQQAVTTAVADAKKAGTDAQSTANTANSTANAAKTAAATADGKAVAAQNTANSAKSTADTAVANAKTAQTTADAAKSAAATADSKAVAAQTAANNANSNANGRVPTSRKINGMDLTADRNLTAAQVGALTQADGDARYQLKGQASGVTLGAKETVQETFNSGADRTAAGVTFLFNFGSSAGSTGAWSRQRLPENVVVTNFRSSKTSASNPIITSYIDYRKITGGI